MEQETEPFEDTVVRGGLDDYNDLVEAQNHAEAESLPAEEEEASSAPGGKRPLRERLSNSLFMLGGQLAMAAFLLASRLFATGSFGLVVFLLVCVGLAGITHLFLFDPRISWLVAALPVAAIVLGLLAVSHPAASTPVIHGTTKVGQTLQVDPTRWSVPLVGIRSQKSWWERCDLYGENCQEIAVSAGQRSYTLTPADQGKHLRFVEQAASRLGQRATRYSLQSLLVK